MAALNSPPSTFNFGAYWKFFDIGLQNTFVYRWNFLLRSIFGIVPLVGTIYLWDAVFKSKGGTIAGYDFAGMIFYFLLVVLVDQLITPTEDEWQIAAEIRDGKISAYLVKPMNYLGYRVALYLSYRLLYMSVVLIPILILGWFLRAYIQLPAHGVTWLALAASTLMAAGIQFFICYALAMIAFWVLEISTIIFILYSFEYFLSGHVFPLDIMPVAQGSCTGRRLPTRCSSPCRSRWSGCKARCSSRGCASRRAGWSLLISRRACSGTAACRSIRPSAAEPARARGEFRLMPGRARRFLFATP